MCGHYPLTLTTKQPAGVRYLPWLKTAGLLKTITLRGHCHGQRLGFHEPTRTVSGTGHCRAGYRSQFHLRAPHRRAGTDPSTRQSGAVGVGRARTLDRGRATPAPPPSVTSRLIQRGLTAINGRRWAAELALLLPLIV